MCPDEISNMAAGPSGRMERCSGSGLGLGKAEATEVGLIMKKSGVGGSSTRSAVSYIHLTLPTTCRGCRSRWSPYH